MTDRTTLAEVKRADEAGFILGRDHHAVGKRASTTQMDRLFGIFVQDTGMGHYRGAERSTLRQSFFSGFRRGQSGAANPKLNPAPAGVQFVLGIVRKAGQRVSEVQSVLFDKAKWTVAKAKEWLAGHGFSAPAVDEGKDYLRFRQKPPKYGEYATVKSGARRNPIYKGWRLSYSQKAGKWSVYFSYGPKAGETMQFDSMDQAKRYLDGYRSAEEAFQKQTRGKVGNPGLDPSVHYRRGYAKGKAVAKQESPVGLETVAHAYAGQFPTSQQNEIYSEFYAGLAESFDAFATPQRKAAVGNPKKSSVIYSGKRYYLRSESEPLRLYADPQIGVGKNRMDEWYANYGQQFVELDSEGNVRSIGTYGGILVEEFPQSRSQTVAAAKERIGGSGYPVVGFESWRRAKITSIDAPSRGNPEVKPWPKGFTGGRVISRTNPEWTAWRITQKAPGGKLLRRTIFAPDRNHAEQSAREALQSEPAWRGHTLVSVEPTKDPRIKNPGLVDSIRSGDRVTYVDRFGKEHTGKAVMRSSHGGWVLNMGGAHGTPAVVDDSNIVRVKPSSGGKGGAHFRFGNPKKYPHAPKSLSVFDKHRLKIAYDTLRMPEAMAAVMGGGIDTHEKARAVIRELTGKEPKENPSGYDPAPVKIPAVITHSNMEPLLDALTREPEFQPGPAKINRRGWYRRPVYLEFPTGELAKDRFQTMALVGWRDRHLTTSSLPIEKGDRFDAQGLEGKVRVEKDLFGALMNLRDILPRNRGQIVTRSRELRSNPSVTLKPGFGGSRWYWKSEWGSGDAPTVEQAKSMARGQIQTGGGGSRIMWYHYDAGGNLVKKEGAGWGFGQPVHEEYTPPPPRRGRRGRGNPPERPFYTIQPSDVGKISIRAFGRVWTGFMRPIKARDVGKRIYKVGEDTVSWGRRADHPHAAYTEGGNPSPPEAAGLGPFYTIRRSDVGKDTIRAFGRAWAVSDFIGHIGTYDVGKRVYKLGEDQVRVESSQQLEQRRANPAEIRRGAKDLYYPGKVRIWYSSRKDLAAIEKIAAKDVDQTGQPIYIVTQEGKLLSRVDPSGTAALPRPWQVGNPSEDATLASALSEKFHGTPAKETFEVYEELQERSDLAGIGRLVDLTIVTPTNLEAVIEFPNDAPLVASSPDGKQLFLVGGDQTIDLAPLKMENGKWRRDSMILGDLKKLTYRTAKAFDKFETLDYFHKVGEKTGVLPILVYDAMNHKLSVSGGQYEVKPEGITN